MVKPNTTALYINYLLGKQTFSKIRYLLDTETAELLYKSTIQQIFDYNDFFYNLLS